MDIECACLHLKKKPFLKTDNTGLMSILSLCGVSFFFLDVYPLRAGIWDTHKKTRNHL